MGLRQSSFPALFAQLLARRYLMINVFIYLFICLVIYLDVMRLRGEVGEARLEVAFMLLIHGHG